MSKMTALFVGAASGRPYKTHLLFPPNMDLPRLDDYKYTRYTITQTPRGWMTKEVFASIMMNHVYHEIESVRRDHISEKEEYDRRRATEKTKPKKTSPKKQVEPRAESKRNHVPYAWLSGLVDTDGGIARREGPTTKEKRLDSLSENQKYHSHPAPFGYIIRLVRLTKSWLHGSVEKSLHCEQNEESVAVNFGELILPRDLILHLPVAYETALSVDHETVFPIPCWWDRQSLFEGDEVRRDFVVEANGSVEHFAKRVSMVVVLTKKAGLDGAGTSKQMWLMIVWFRMFDSIVVRGGDENDVEFC
ncbi:hypothetical protein BLNAU_16984 [Blattamonas nauphoetae]|uniref:Uncharacterized protein n=1 Tax=Blattamonas nauphoetae TaxID=2049346 RepID=A0ABQ9X7V7_9EUKA|nr:hypothetical protein BLNAU_16984 [Blattamonas nauphoetae]